MLLGIAQRNIGVAFFRRFSFSFHDFGLESTAAQQSVLFFPFPCTTAFQRLPGLTGHLHIRMSWRKEASMYDFYLVFLRILCAHGF